MSTPWSKRAPFPWDAELDIGDGSGWHGLMLVPSQDGLLVTRRTNPLGAVSPTTFEYGSYPPEVESTYVFGRLVGGMGEAMQSSATSERYRYAEGVDCSIGGMPRLGPLFAAATLPAPLGGDTVVRQFIAGPAPGGDVVYCLRGRAVYALVAGTWTLSKDFGGINNPLQAVVYRGTAGPRRLIVTTALGELWGYDGTAWAQGLTGMGPPVPLASYCAVVGRELYVGADESVYVGDTGDPLAVGGGFFGGAIQVGQTGSAITYLAALSGTLYVFKTDGVFTLNADGSDNDLFPELRADARAGNGLNAVPWRDALYVRYGDAYYRLAADASLQPIGPERLVENRGPVRGLLVAASPHADWFLYGALYDAGHTTSYLCKYGTWTPAEGSEAPARYRFDEVWHGALAAWNKQVTRLDALDLGEDPVLWVGFADGSVESTALPAGTPDPALDGRCRFVASGTVYAPLHDQVFGADRKSFHAFTALAPLLNTSLTCRIRYRVDPPNFYPDPSPPYQTLAPEFQASGQRRPLPDLTDGVPRDASTGWRLDFGVELRTDTELATPVLEGVALHEAIRPDLHLTWSFTAAASNRLARRDGVVSRRTAEGLRALLRTAAAAPGHVRLRTPDGLVGGFAFVSYAEKLAPDRGRDGLDWAVGVECGQFR